jgi:glucuronide carrier protein
VFCDLNNRILPAQGHFSLLRHTSLKITVNSRGKLTQSLGGAATAWALALGGYVSASAAVATPEQPASALTAIKVVFGLVPAVAAILAMLVFIVYPLTDQRFREIRDESEGRKRELGHAVLGEGVTV